MQYEQYELIPACPRQRQMIHRGNHNIKQYEVIINDQTLSNNRIQHHRNDNIFIQICGEIFEVTNRSINCVYNYTSNIYISIFLFFFCNMYFPLTTVTSSGDAGGYCLIGLIFCRPRANSSVKGESQTYCNQWYILLIFQQTTKKILSALSYTFQ